MTVEDYRGKMLQNSIESIVIREKEFESLKQIINELFAGKKSSKKMKEIIIKKLIQFRLRIIKELLDFIPYYFDDGSYNNYSKLKKDWKERNKLLEIIDRKVEVIYKKLPEKYKE